MIVLDTNVVSELMKASRSEAVLAWLSTQQEVDDLFVTAITLAEVLYGIELLPKGKRRDGLERQADAMFTQDFAGRILSFDDPAARIFPLLAAGRRKLGRPIEFFDAQIAAITRAHSATLATRNTDDFEGCGVRLINPWKE
ncbi:MAG TPA: type II toxin-antitoxin system VapC family toxin [Candidatus Sulfotelmatobacter sp.]|nr:type II toxin-antitoxin system VapC family toxin [Candidatus Sulfotelmatobacter sp.]